MKPPLEYIGEGRTRKVYLTRSGRYVLKVPVDGYGENANATEAEDYKRGGFLGRQFLARCRRVTINGLWCLLMEKVNPLSFGDEQMPDWASFVDCRQVGINRRGKVVAYDWA